MPFVHIKLVNGVFSTDQKEAMATAITDVIMEFDGSEAFREVVWVLIEELYTDDWHVGRRPLAGPKSLMQTPCNSKTIFRMINGHTVSNTEFAQQIPPK